MQSITGPVAGESATIVPDAVGRALSIAVGTGETTSLSYDAMGALQSVTPPGRTAHEFEYTPAGLLSRYTAPGGPPPVVTEDEYNLARNPVQRTLADGSTLTATYDPVTGKAATLTAQSFSLALGYHPTSGQLASVERTDSFGTQTLSYGYDGPFLVSETLSGGTGLPSGSVTQPRNDDFWVDRLVINGAEVAAYSYDDDGLLIGAGPMSIGRDAESGAIVSTTLSQLSTSQAYNGFGEPSLLSASHGSTSYFTETLSERDKSGRILERSESVYDGTVVSTTGYEYGYDAAGRLTQVFTNGVQTSQYEYMQGGSSANGNRLAHVTSLGVVRGQYDAQDRLTRYCPEDGSGNAAPIAGLPCYGYTYKASGELLVKTDLTNDEQVAYSYDEIGALRTVFLPDGTTLSYEIDGAGRRVGKRVNGAVVRRWLYRDALSPVAELDGSNNVVSTFVYGTRAHVPDFMVRGGVTYRLVTDHLGSVVLVVDVASGAVAQRLSYDEFGVVLMDTNPGWQPFGFAGGLYDADTGLVRFGARDYDAVTGRWTAKDPIGFAGGDTNLYAYCANDSVNCTDPSGLILPFVAAVCAFGGCEAAASAALWGAALLTAGLAGGAAAELINYAKDGTPGNNQAQNKQFADAVRAAGKAIGRALTADEIRRLHDEISGEDLGFHDIVEAAKDLCGG